MISSLPSPEVIAKHTVSVRLSVNPKTLQSRTLRYEYLKKGFTTKGKPFQDKEMWQRRLEQARRRYE